MIWCDQVWFEPFDKVLALAAVVETPVELVADFTREPRDFSVASHIAEEVKCFIPSL